MKNLKFLLIPKSNDFKDIINIKEISNELKKKGYYCISLLSSVNDKNLEFILKMNNLILFLELTKVSPKE